MTFAVQVNAVGGSATTDSIKVTLTLRNGADRRHVHTAAKYCHGYAGHVGERKFHRVDDGKDGGCAAEPLAQFQIAARAADVCVVHVVAACASRLLPLDSSACGCAIRHGARDWASAHAFDDAFSSDRPDWCPAAAVAPQVVTPAVHQVRRRPELTTFR